MLNLAIRRRVSLITMPELLLLLVAIVWGTSYGLTKSAIAYTTVSTFIAIRFGITFFLLAPMVIKEFFNNKNQDWFVALPTGVILALIFFFEVYGVSQTTASNAAFLISLNVIFTAFADIIISKRKPDRELILSTLFSTIGVFLLTYSYDLHISFNQGDICIISAAVLRAIMVTMTKKLTYQKQITNTALTCIQSFVVAISALSLSIISSGIPTSFVILPLHFWLIMLFLILFCTLFAFYAQNYAVRNISPTKASLLMGSEPLFGAIFSLLWLDEVLTSIQWVGAITLVISVLIASINKQH